MPTGVFTMPNGRDAEFDFPEGTTEDQAKAFADNWWKTEGQGQAESPPPPPERTIPQMMGSASISALKGLSAIGDVAMGGAALSSYPLQFATEYITGKDWEPVGPKIWGARPSEGYRKLEEEIIQPGAGPKSATERAVDTGIELTSGLVGAPLASMTRKGLAAGAVLGSSGAEFIEDEGKRSIAKLAAVLPMVVYEVPTLYRAGKQWLSGNTAAYKTMTGEPAIKAVEDARAKGITLSPGEATGDYSVLAAEKAAMRSAGPGAERAATFLEDTRPAEQQAAIERLKEGVYPTARGAAEESKDIVGKAAERLQQLKSRRREITEPLYRSAYRGDADVPLPDVRRIYSELEAKAASATGSEAKGYNAILKAMVAKDGTLKKSVEDLHGIIKTTGVVGDIAKNPKYGGAYAYINETFKPQIEAAMNRPGTNFAKAQSEYARLSRPIDDFKSSRAGDLAAAAERGTMDDVVENAAGKAMKPDAPASVAKAMDELSQIDPAAPFQMFRARMEAVSSTLKTENPQTFGKQLYSALIGKPNSKERIVAQTALGPKGFKEVEETLHLMSKSALSSGDSITAPLAEAIKNAAATAQSRSALGTIVSLPAETLGALTGALRTRLFTAMNDKVVEAITSGDRMKLEELRRYLKLDMNAGMNVQRLMKFLAVDINNIARNDGGK